MVVDEVHSSTQIVIIFSFFLVFLNLNGSKNKLESESKVE